MSRPLTFGINRGGQGRTDRSAPALARMQGLSRGAGEAVPLSAANSLLPGAGSARSRLDEM